MLAVTHRAGACDTCADPLPPGYARCRHCCAAVTSLPQRADLVVPIALSLHGGVLAESLWRYKTDGLEPRPNLVATLLGDFVRMHEHCVARAAGVTAFDRVTVVPSARGRSPHPLYRLAAGLPAISNRLREFAAAPCARVLLLDDTWTTGWHAQQAAAALKRTGARVVVVVVVGRSLRRAPPAWPVWQPGTCAVHAEAVTAGSSPPRSPGVP